MSATPSRATASATWGPATARSPLMLRSIFECNAVDEAHELVGTKHHSQAPVRRWPAPYTVATAPLDDLIGATALSAETLERRLAATSMREDHGCSLRLCVAPVHCAAIRTAEESARTTRHGLGGGPPSPPGPCSEDGAVQAKADEQQRDRQH